MTSLYEEVNTPPASDVPVRRVTINVNGEDRTVDVHIRRLRLALEDSGHENLVQTVRGVGYRLRLPTQK